MGRLVVVLCGPPGSGKTTAARASGLEVFDRDDDRWPSEREFREAIGRLASRRDARAVVIRSGATSSARAKAARLVGATHVFLCLLPLDECVERVRARGRDDMVAGIASVPKWFAAFDDRDGVRVFPGWDAIESDDADVMPLGASSRMW